MKKITILATMITLPLTCATVNAETWKEVYLLDGKVMPSKNEKWDSINYFFIIREKTKNGLPVGKYLNVKKGDKEAVVNPSGKYVVKPEWDDVYRMKNYLLVRKEGKYGLIGKGFKLVAPCKYERIIPSMVKDQFEVKIDGKFAAMNQEMRFVIQPSEHEILSYGSPYGYYKVNGEVISATGKKYTQSTAPEIKRPKCSWEKKGSYEIYREGGYYGLKDKK